MALLGRLRPVNINRFGGLNTLVDRMALSPPFSPECHDVEFVPGSVKSRGGTTWRYEVGDSERAIGIDSHQLLSGLRTLLVDSAGNLKVEETTDTLTTVDTSIVAADLDPRMYSSTLFNRALICANNGGVGLIEPRTYDGTNIDRFSYGAPGFGASFADSANPGSVTAGTRIGAVAFIMRSGFVTPISWSATFTTSGINTIAVSNIPIGPPACVARMLFVSPPLIGSQFVAGDLYHMPSIMLISNNDPLVTTWELNFNEADLTGSGLRGSDFVGYSALGDCVGVYLYNDRAVAFGEVPLVGPRDNATIFDLAVAPQSAQVVNLRFDGGPSAGATPPYAWSEQTAGGSFEQLDGLPNPVWKITSDGATLDLGRLRTGSSVGSSILEAALALNVEYGVRFRIRSSVGPLGGGLAKVELGSTSGAFSPLVATASPSTSSVKAWQTIDAVLGTIPDYGSGLYLDISMAIPCTDAGEWIAIEVDGFFRTSQWNPDVVGSHYLRVSAVRDLERFYDDDRGYVNVRPYSGQNVRGVTQLGSTLYTLGENSVSSVFDPGSVEASSWPVAQVTDLVGIKTPRAIGVGQGWVAILSQQGLYFFDGGTPRLLSREIQPTWDAFEWSKAYRFWCVVDNIHKRILCGVMSADAGAWPDKVYVLDYNEGFGEGQRKWTSWTGDWVGVNAANMLERPDGIKHLFFAGGDVAQYDPDVVNDGQGVADATFLDPIPSYYELAPLGLENDITQTGRVRVWASGGGVLEVYKRNLVDDAAIFWQPVLSDPGRRELERLVDEREERIGIGLGNRALDSYWRVDRVELMQGPNPFAPYRNQNVA